MTAHETKDPTRDVLIKAGRKLFAKHGLDGVTVRDIAQEAGVNVAAVSYHFEGKEGLYRAVIEEFAKEKQGEIRDQIGAAPKNADEYRFVFRMMVAKFLADVMQTPEVCRIMMKEIDAGLPIAKDIFEKTMLENFNMIIGFHKNAQELGIVKRGLNPQVVALMIQGIVFHLQRVEDVRKKFFKESMHDEKTQKDAVDTICEIFFDGMLVKAKE
ncbi:MAG TPA: TetR/AcrR family transcriptional regulator [Bdellovibrionales bacterium]|nr:TetR/AcrR family transcriptional regulator [Bdellovibrionales bacterium]